MDDEQIKKLVENYASGVFDIDPDDMPDIYMKPPKPSRWKRFWYWLRRKPLPQPMLIPKDYLGPHFIVSTDSGYTIDVQTAQKTLGITYMGDVMNGYRLETAPLGLWRLSYPDGTITGPMSKEAATDAAVKHYLANKNLN